MNEDEEKTTTTTNKQIRECGLFHLSIVELSGAAMSKDLFLIELKLVLIMRISYMSHKRSKYVSNLCIFAGSALADYAVFHATKHSRKLNKHIQKKEEKFILQFLVC